LSGTSAMQNVGGSVVTQFEKLILNNSYGMNMNNDVVVNRSITFTAGKIYTNSYKLIVTNKDVASMVNYTVSKYVVGNLRRYVGLGDYYFPVGTDNYYEQVRMVINTLSPTVNYLDVRFVISNEVLPPPGIDVSPKLINECLNYGYWNIIPDDTSGVSSYTLFVRSDGHTNGGGSASDYAILTDLRDGLGWRDFGTNNYSWPYFSGTAIVARRNVMTKFGNLIVGKAIDPNQPLVINMLKNKNAVIKMVDSSFMQLYGINAEFNNSSGGILKLRDSSTFDVVGHVNNQIYSRIENDGRIKLTNNWYNYGTSSFAYQNGTKGIIEFYGDSLQEIAGDSLSKFEKLIINNKGKGIKLSQHIVVSDTLFMNDGDVNLTNFNIDLLSTGYVTGETPNNRFKAVDGMGNEGMGNGVIKYLTVINNVTDYNIAGLGFSVTTSYNLGSTLLQRGHKKQLINGMSSINRFYDFTPTLVNSVNYTFQYYDVEVAEQPNSEDSLVLVHYHNNEWIPIYTNRDTPNNILWTITDKFSKITAITSEEQPLGAEFLVLNAKYRGVENSVLCSWVSLSSNNKKIERYIVERSTNAVDYEVVGAVESNKNSSDIEQHYRYYDDRPVRGVVLYYRIKQIEENGDYKYSNVAYVFVPYQTNGKYAVVYPNPTNENNGAWLRLENFDEGIINMYIINMYGQLLKSKVLDNNNSNVMTVDIRREILNLEQGVYFIILNTNRERYSLKLIITK